MASYHDDLNNYGREIAINRDRIRGYLFKSRSPNGGLDNVTVYDSNAAAVSSATGIDASIAIDSLSCLPVESEDHLHDPAVRDNLLE